MSPEIQIIFVFGVFLGLLVLGMSVPFAIAVPSLVYVFLQTGVNGFRALGVVSWGSTASFVLTAIPLFLLMAEIMQRSGLTTRIYTSLAKLVSLLPGRLLQTNVIGCAIFSSISGSSIATAAAIGGVALPELQRQKYDPRLSAGSLAAGGTLGILIPPSLAMIIYSSFTETSVARLFMAGVGPGLLLTAMFCTYIAIVALARPHVAPKSAGLADMKLGAWLRALADILPFVVLILAVLGSIYTGFATPTESAALGCIAVLVLCKLFGQMSWRIVGEALHNTVVVVGNILFIVLSAYLFSYAISTAGVGDRITEWVVSLKLSKLEFYVAVFILYTILGCLVESVGMIVLTVPLLFPILPQFGIDPIWFGIMLVVFIELGQISPPIGINLYVVQAMWNGKLSDVVMGTIPFHIIMIVLLVLLVIWPEIALWLPSRMMAR